MGGLKGLVMGGIQLRSLQAAARGPGSCQKHRGRRLPQGGGTRDHCQSLTRGEWLMHCMARWACHASCFIWASRRRWVGLGGMSSLVRDSRRSAMH